MKTPFRILAATAFAFGPSQMALSQTGGTSARFEVTAVRRSMPADEYLRLTAAGRGPAFGILVRGNRVEIGRQTLGELICAAYRVRPYQVVAPEWLVSEITPPGQLLRDDVFDIYALLPEGTDRRQLPGMLERLLKERFGMVTHRDQRELPVFALRAANGGANLRPGAEDDSPPESGVISVGLDNGEEQKIERTEHGSVVWARGFGKMQMSSTRTGMHIEASDLTMDRLVQMISPYFERPVIDATGLSGGYRVNLDVGPEDQQALRAAMQAAAAPSLCPPSGCPSSPGGSTGLLGRSLSDSIKEMGLRLSSEKHLVDVVVVDHIERIPTEN